MHSRYFVWIDDVRILGFTSLLVGRAVGVCDPCNKETHPALFCENLNIIDLGNVRQTHKSNPNCGFVFAV